MEEKEALKKNYRCKTDNELIILTELWNAHKSRNCLTDIESRHLIPLELEIAVSNHKNNKMSALSSPVFFLLAQSKFLNKYFNDKILRFCDSHLISLFQNVTMKKKIDKAKEYQDSCKVLDNFIGDAYLTRSKVVEIFEDKDIYLNLFDKYSNNLVKETLLHSSGSFNFLMCLLDSYFSHSEPTYTLKDLPNLASSSSTISQIKSDK